MGMLFWGLEVAEGSGAENIMGVVDRLVSGNKKMLQVIWVLVEHADAGMECSMLDG